MLDVRLFAKVKMRRQRVLEKMNDEVSDQDEQIRDSPGHGHGLWKNLQNRRGQHESSAEREEIFQILPRPLPAQDEESAKYVGCRGRETKQQREEHAGSWGVHDE